ncbi:MAG: hypothetical protein O2968_19010 [Acidobacteria bacterium]|nr:hypothetical protein [Acidobacteriota bacterium]
MRKLLHLLVLIIGLPLLLSAAVAVVAIDTPMDPPYWALLERQLLDANADAVTEWADKYLDDRGYLQITPRWGGLDGPDDATENFYNWPLLHALGASGRVLEIYKKAWEGHLLQFTEAKTEVIALAKQGMYHKEFITTFDWEHTGEGLQPFFYQALSDHYDPRFQARMRRFAGFYMDEDPGAKNYDPKHKIIRSFFNGSTGPLLRPATPAEWAGDPMTKFGDQHNASTYPEMLAHFAEYANIVGDSPQNLCATSMAMNAYMIDHEAKYKDWLLEYVDAWLERTRANGNNIPSVIGLDGTIGGGWDGKWYGGIYGWGFSPIEPTTGRPANRNTVYRGLRVGFLNALLLTGDHKYVDVIRKQMDNIFAAKKVVNGVTMYPSMYGDEGWYGYRKDPPSHVLLDVYLATLAPADRGRLPTDDWLRFLDGADPTFPEKMLRSDLSNIRRRLEQMRQDPTTPDTRYTDDIQRYNPASTDNLVKLMLGGNPAGQTSNMLHSQVRYFDPVKRRAGLPADVAALVEKITPRGVEVTLVNVNPVSARRLVVQTGAYAEHRCVKVLAGGIETAVNDSSFEVRLAPGAGSRLVIAMERYANQPALAHPY